MNIPNFNIQQPDLLGSFANVVNIGNSIKNQELQQRKINLAEQAYKAQQDKALRFRKDMANLSKNPTPKNALNMMLKNPEQYEMLSKAHSLIDANQQEDRFQINRAVYEAAKNKSPEAVKRALGSRYEAALNSGDTEQANFLQGMMAFADSEDGLKSLEGSTLANLASLTKGRDYLDQLAEMDEKKQSLIKSKIDNKFLEEEKKLDMKIKVMEQKRKNAKTDADIREAESKIAKAEFEKSEIYKEREREIKGEAFSIDRMLDAADRALRLAEVPQYGGLSTTAEAATGVFGSMITTDEDVKNFSNQIKTIKSKLFLLEAPKLKGVMSDSDKEDAKNAMQNLDLGGGPEFLLKNIRSIKEIFERNRALLEEYYGAEIPSFREEIIERDEFLKPTKQGGEEAGRTLGSVMDSQGELRYSPDELEQAFMDVMRKRVQQ